MKAISPPFARQEGECTAFFLQDLGAMGPDGHPRLLEALKDHHILTNSHPSNKSRTVALIINKLWNIVGPIRKDEYGCVIGTTVEKDGAKMFLASVYMPARLNKCGIPEFWEESKKSFSNDQNEAHNAYSLLKDWCELSPYWVLGGDFNEIRDDSLDRIATSKVPTAKHKFITEFLRESHGVDIWRTLYPHTPGVTFKSSSIATMSRLDYFLASPLVNLKHTKMTIAHWLTKKDHAQITLTTTIPTANRKGFQIPVDDIPRPRLKNISQEKIDKLRMICNEQTHWFLSKISSDVPQVDPDQISRSFAKMLVDTAISVAGRKRTLHRPRSRYTTKLTAEIRTIHEARNIIRALFFREVKEEEIEGQRQLLHGLLDRLFEWN